MSRMNGSPKMGTKVHAPGSPKMGRERSRTPPNPLRGQPMSSPKLGRSVKAHSLGNIHANNELSIAEPPPPIQHASSGPIHSSSHIHAPRPLKAPMVMDSSETVPHPLDIKLMSGGPPRAGDVTHVGATRIHSLGYGTGSDSSRSATPTHAFDNHLEDKEEMRLRELEEARARAAQMEKTMRWWSDCTANWREKWGKVRAERNKAREEVRQLRLKLEATMKECISLKREKHGLLSDNDQLRTTVKELKGDVDGPHLEINNTNEQPERDVGVMQLPRDLTAARPNVDFVSQIMQSQNIVQEPPPEVTLCDTMSQTDLPMCRPMEIQTSPMWEGELPNGGLLGGLDLSSRRGSQSGSSHSSRDRDSPSRRSKKDMPSPSEEKAEQRAFMLQMKLDEASKTVQVERQEKDTLHQTINKLEQEVTALKIRNADLQEAKDAALRELQLLKASHQHELGRITNDLEDEASTRNHMDKRLGALRKELERLQAENAAEWGKRERLETEKLNLERENKKQKAEIDDLQETISTRSKQTTIELENTIKNLQEDLKVKTMELTDLKHAHSKMKKQLADKLAELDHTSTKCVQHEEDVKKLRGRVEDLKRDLAKCEDEVDERSNFIKKIQRNLDETLQQNENLTLQVEHLQSRLRTQTSTAGMGVAKRRISTLKVTTSSDNDDTASD
ncbi:coiled-coil domain-containing protein 102A-like [Diadema setosum]|uniref:coiled-coil domain-containing protein 102A-like n=1 Tax=Diadema setosum TaxID=31175 RepID=UPI003B3A8E2C